MPSKVSSIFVVFASTLLLLVSGCGDSTTGPSSGSGGLTLIGQLQRWEEECFDVSVGGNYAYLAYPFTALHRIDISDPTDPQPGGSVSLGSKVRDVFYQDNYIYISGDYFGGSGTQSLNVVEASSMELVAYIETGGNPDGICASGGYAYLSASRRGTNCGVMINVFDISNPTNPDPVDTYLWDYPDYVDTWGISYSDNYLFIALGLEGLLVVNASNPNELTLATHYEETGYLLDVYAQDGIAYIADRDYGLQVLDVQDPANPVYLGGLDTDGYAYGVCVSDGYGYIADGPAGVKVMDVSNPSTPLLIDSLETPGWAYGVTTYGNYIYITDAEGYLSILSFNP